MPVLPCPTPDVGMDWKYRQVESGEWDVLEALVRTWLLLLAPIQSSTCLAHALCTEQYFRIRAHYQALSHHAQNA